ncbi:MAG: pilin [Patescibacteria group bacterium]
MDGIENILRIIGELINLATPIVVALALLYFFWGLASYILKAGEEDGRKKAKDTMIWGILALFVMVSVWGIINVVRDTFEIDNNNQIDIPIVDIDQSGGSAR